MKVAVFAGTPVDTEMGVELLKQRGYETLSYPMASTPQEQTLMQYYSQEELEKLFFSGVQEAIDNNVEAIFIYCNSLSVAVNYNKISQELQIPIITPIESYQNIAQEYSSVALLAANSFSAYRIDELLRKANPHLHTVTFGMMNLVEAIERGECAEKIMEKLHLRGLLNYLAGIVQEGDKIEAVLLGCTHFPYMMEEFQRILWEQQSGGKVLHICNPAEEMLERLAKVKFLCNGRERQSLSEML